MAALRSLILAVLLLTACSESPSPAACRDHGVAVADGDVVTGRIVAERYAPADVVKAKCLGHTGCARAPSFQNYVFINPKGEYEIWYSDPRLRTHEICHGKYEQQQHIQEASG